MVLGAPDVLSVSTASDMAARLSAVAPRYRFSAAIGHAFDISTNEYGAVVSLANDLRRRPEDAEDFALTHLEWGSRDAVQLRQYRIADMLDALACVEHEAPPSQIEALTVYCATIAQANRGAA